MESIRQRGGEPWKAFAIRQRTPDVKREIVLKTAAHLFLERGYRKTSMIDLANRLNISKPAVYHYFPNKEAMLVGCYQEGICMIEARLKLAVEALKGGGSGLEKTRAFVSVYVDAVTSLDFGLCVASLDDRELSANTQVEVRRLKRRIDTTLRQFIDEGIADKTIKTCNSKLAAFAIAGAVNWVGTWYDPAGPMSTGEIAENYTNLLVDGLANCEPDFSSRSKRIAQKTRGSKRLRK